VTASHNPYKYNGIKYKAGFGGSALPEIISAIESRLGKSRTKSLTPEQALSQRLIEYFDPEEAYVAQLRELVDLRKIAAAGQKIVIDPMHGAGAGYIRKLLSEAGLEIIEVRGKYDPLFGGVNPEPIAENLQALSREVVNQGALAGFATDGDADRVGAVDAHGEYVNSHIIYALLLRYLVTERKWTGGVVKTFSTSQMIDKLARKYGLKVFETPIGFKYICKLFLSEDILLGGEESGGLGFKNHIPERDGILASLLLMEMMATYNKPLHEIVEDLMQELGHHDYGRIDHHLSPELMGQTVPRLKANPPTTVAGIKVKEVLDLDGIKFVLEDGSWILFRESGTEPMLRIYAEAGSRSAVNKLLSEGKKF
ncbi:MAG TPA: phosphoglucomutase/phosphomannomutase family protein, partial [Bacillota bacterium]|nr:phosphoglucomutase/phosphomannomutase family protein [Bacillota bacterium]